MAAGSGTDGNPPAFSIATEGTRTARIQRRSFPVVLRAPSHEGQRVSRRPVKPLRVIHEAQDWSLLGHGGQQAQHRTGDEEPIGGPGRPATPPSIGEQLVQRGALIAPVDQGGLWIILEILCLVLVTRNSTPRVTDALDSAPVSAADAVRRPLRSTTAMFTVRSRGPRDPGELLACTDAAVGTGPGTPADGAGRFGHSTVGPVPHQVASASARPGSPRSPAQAT
jgi:hypothetical protein